MIHFLRLVLVKYYELPRWSSGKESNVGDARDVSSIPGSTRSPGGGNDNSLQHSCPENPVDQRGAWWATVRGVAVRHDLATKQQTRCFNVEGLGSVPGSGRSPGGGNGYPLQYSCLENSIDRGTWQATIQGVAKSWTWLSGWHSEDPLWMMVVKWFRGGKGKR